MKLLPLFLMLICSTVSANETPVLACVCDEQRRANETLEQRADRLEQAARLARAEVRVNRPKKRKP